MVHFSKLKLYGFKSFVDKTEIEIGEGMNGIVGPNGCGKSNLVEALRWVMGEKSAKNMRGGGMEDVIFAGTSKRPSRNMAEATIVIDNSDGTAPAPFNTATEIEITRRIEKDKGSQYRVNGKAVRARDVNLLFADTMTGANSPALVSQGRITEIIVAKPQDRRRILEESAGISGLHTRRHEAELRLRAAEQNLTRLDDVMNDMRSRLVSLKRQARQAERYKELSGSIRRLDMALAWSEWRDIREKIKTGRTSFATENDRVQAALEKTKTLTREIESLEQSLPESRKENMEARAILQNFRVSLERLEQDLASKSQGLKEAEAAKEQLEHDITFTRTQQEQLCETLETARTALKGNEEQQQALPARLQTLEEDANTFTAQLETLQTERQSVETRMAVIEQSRKEAESRQQDFERRLENLAQTKQTLVEKIAEYQSSYDLAMQDSCFQYDLSALEKDLSDLNVSIEETETTYKDTKEKKSDAFDTKNALNSDIRGLESEIRTLNDLINNSVTDSDLAPDQALLENVTVDSGYEKAFAVSLGQWASLAGMDDSAAVYWQEQTALVTVETPTGYTALADYVKAPKSLNAYLMSVGVTDTLPQTTPALRQGQMIIAKDGSLMRWDGLIVKAEAAANGNTAHILLEQKNRVKTLENDLTEKQQQREDNERVLATLTEAVDTAQSRLRDLQDRYAVQSRILTDTRHQQDRLSDRIKSITENKDEAQSRLDSLTKEYQEVEAQYKEATALITTKDDTETVSDQSRLDSLSVEINTIKSRRDVAQTTLAQLKFEQNALQGEQQRLTQTIEQTTAECARMDDRLQDLSERFETMTVKVNAYKAAQDQDNEDHTRETLLSQIADQDAVVTGISIRLEEQEKAYQALQINLREAEGIAATARENRALAQANVANAEEELNRIQNAIREQFETTPQALEEQTLSLFEDGLPAIADLQTERETVIRQRDGIGPVNLRAAIESQETEQQLADIEAEYTDLTKAIEQLRGGIAKLNREARERLAVAFQRVDRHFQRLFNQLFGGGAAHLEMIESEDPLESGLEIYAQPPGKALQKLSLLSGGEQTLTATALIFGMFLTNPSPICVLDEIDAPLDDANVDRVCTLMETIARETQTRFIVITHHRMTMARMDRLYGVTMAERGVSQLVSVDLTRQEELALNETAS